MTRFQKALGVIRVDLSILQILLAITLLLVPPSQAIVHALNDKFPFGALGYCLFTFASSIVLLGRALSFMLRPRSESVIKFFLATLPILFYGLATLYAWMQDYTPSFIGVLFVGGIYVLILTLYWAFE